MRTYLKLRLFHAHLTVQSSREFLVEFHGMKIVFEVPPSEQRLFKPVLNKIEPFESIKPFLKDCFERLLKFTLHFS